MIEFSISIGCPILCTQCPQDAIQSAYKGPRWMRMETFTECVEKVPDPLVSFAGFAEPYLNPFCTEMIRHASSLGKQLQLYTTCVGMNFCDVDTLARLDFKILCLHLPDRGGNAKIKITDDYLAVVDAMAETFPKAQMMQLGNMHPAMAKYAGRIKPTYIHTRAGNVTNHLTGTVQLKQRGPLKCSQNEKIEDNVILPDGRVVLCCSDWGLQHILGNLLTQSWDEICNGPAKDRMRKLMRSENCLCSTCEFAQPA